MCYLAETDVLRPVYSKSCTSTARFKIIFSLQWTKLHSFPQKWPFWSLFKNQQCHLGFSLKTEQDFWKWNCSIENDVSQQQLWWHCDVLQLQTSSSREINHFKNIQNIFHPTNFSVWPHEQHWGTEKVGQARFNVPLDTNVILKMVLFLRMSKCEQLSDIIKTRILIGLHWAANTV